MSRADSRSSRSGKRPRPAGPGGVAPGRHKSGTGDAERGAPEERGADRRRGAARHETDDTHFIYGRNPVREALRGRRQVNRILMVVGDVGDGLEESLREWAAGRPKPPVTRMTPSELATLVKTGDHQGIAAEVGPYPYTDAAKILRDHDLLVALDEVQDPHNLGAVIRTAAAAGAGVVIPRHRAAEITGAVVKASAGVTERAAVAQVRNLADFLMAAKEAGFWVYGASGGAAGDYTEQDYSYPTCFVMGSEGEGLGRRVESVCDVMVGIRLGGGVESLNVSVSAGILLYEAVRQRGAGESGPGEKGAAAGAAGPGNTAPDGAAASGGETRG